MAGICNSYSRDNNKNSHRIFFFPFVLHTADLISHFDAVTSLKWCATGEKRVSIGLRLVVVVGNGQRESWLVRGDLPIDKLSISDEWVVR